MHRTGHLIALVAIGGVMAESPVQAVDIGVETLKYIAIDKETTAGKSKTVFVSKDAGVTKTGDDDVAAISVTLDVRYEGTGGTGVAKFDVPVGVSNGTDGWLVNKASVAKYVNKAAPAGPTGAKVAVIKPGKLLKLIAKTRGDSAVMDLVAAGEPTDSLYTAYTVTETSETNVHCSEFPLGTCSYKLIGGGTGRKLVCKMGIPDPGCTAALSVPTTTSTSTVPASTTTSTTVPAVLEFVVGAVGGTCGEAREGGAAGTVLQTLTCGGVNVGGGCSPGSLACNVIEGPVSQGAVTQLNASCGVTSCTLGARTAVETGSSTNCSDTGCQFGAWLPIQSGSASTCVKNTFASPASGTLDLGTGAFTGSFPLTSAATLTGNAASPCPPCVAGVCDGSAANPGASCTAINIAGNNYECLPATLLGGPIAPVGVALSPIGTGTAFMDTTTNVDQVPGSLTIGEFCPGQDLVDPGTIGCFASRKLSGAVCDYIEERGGHAGAMTIGGGTASTTMASVFCIPSVGNAIVDGGLDLPGPGAISLPGTLELF